ncbi:transporter substrate-binding domain-containing protein [Paracoccus shanxieyensis]|uniref:Transporter substrate-binding protein n=1 Tax=Paracoccus shanxieyensis TaxID=2675752 RepID=A0A6L6ITT8_9RHOB|nr:transporter substrate-binding domain-containing protein [Paracoccus shanxieyensis]MTH63945.1 transporter substrate-binding protein [Paracoccus shanxieyensis]MTH87014.1 transporter substrate-binding protein [Paracoccus shanxieyensis]
MPLLNTSKDSWPVGLLFSGESQTSTVEHSQACATLLAIDEVNGAGGIDGVPLVPRHLPIGPRPDDYRSAAERLCDDHGVRVLFGTHMSNSRKAVLPVVESREALLFYPTLYEGFEFSHHCVYTGAAPNQNSVQLARHLLRHHGKRVFFIGNNYVFAHESNRIMRDLFEQAQGQVVDEVYLPFHAPDEAFATVMARIETLRPDVIYSTVVGSDTIRLQRAFAPTRSRADGAVIASLAMNEADLAQMNADLSEGCLAAAPWFATLQNPASQAFRAGMHRRFGPDIPLTSGAEAAYFQVHLFAQAARQARILSFDAVLAQLGQARFAAPEGDVWIDAATHHTWLWPRIGRVSAANAFEVIEEETAPVKPEPYMVKHSFGNDLISHV